MMSLVNKTLKKLSELGDAGIHSDEEIKDKDGRLTPHPGVSSIDPIEIKGSSPDEDERKFNSDVEDRMNGKDL